MIKQVWRKLKNLISISRRFQIYKLKFKSKREGEIYFDKYDLSGPYHWTLYYERKEPFYSEMVDTVSSLVPQGAYVLDIGCGDGLIANVLSEQRGCTVLGIDIHPLAIAYARKKNKNANRFCVRSAYEISYCGEFDAVVAVEIFEHLRKPHLLLQRCYEALKDDGVLIITTPLHNEAKPPSKYHVKEYTKEEFLGYLEGLFKVFEERIVRRPDGKSDCYICLCTKDVTSVKKG
jgi:2-polyprenyl-3-methyl-5-hydroxy-6-metoxy-1,4-benzoquinol methylase